MNHCQSAAEDWKVAKIAFVSALCVETQVNRCASDCRELLYLFKREGPNRIFTIGEKRMFCDNRKAGKQWLELNEPGF
ncbi:unnamed protein product [Heligmosomoides polygyrus]|uniref:Apple domain-containing protein n=1 Tax=Heligmosomoides polygyrus TaxID=6339 RepID=A0A183F8E6_HELPZ|nr:unnamed protein product [Heligmosomoides polygyrus]